MAKIIGCSIDLSKIDKTKIVAGKNGQKYYSFSVILNDEKDKFGNDAQIKAGQTKEERESGVKADFIGNGKILWEGTSKKKDVPTAKVITNDAPLGNDDGLPF